MAAGEQSKRQQCCHQDGQRRDLERYCRNLEYEIGQDIEPVGVVAQETAYFLKEVDDEVHRHQPAETHHEDFCVLAKEIAKENGHGTTGGSLCKTTRLWQEQTGRSGSRPRQREAVLPS